MTETDGERLPDTLDHWNLALNQARLERFLREFAADCDLRDFLLFDALAAAAGLPINASGPLTGERSLARRPARLWEFVWLFKALELRRGNHDLLVVGGPLTHIVYLAALAGNRVTVAVGNEREATAATEVARVLGITGIRHVHGGAGTLADIPADSCSRALWCSGVEAMGASEQTGVVRRLARALRPGGLAGFTFHYGQRVAGDNLEIAPPHEPPETSRAAQRRFECSGLAIAGNRELDPPVAGLFDGEVAQFTIASLFAGKPPVVPMLAPAPASGGSLLGGLSSPELFAAIGKAAERRRAEQTAMEQEQGTWVNTRAELQKKADVFESIARERLRDLEASHREAATLRAELELITTEAAKRLELIHRLTEDAEQRLELLNELTEAVRAREATIAELQSLRVDSQS